MARTKTNTQNRTKHAEHQDATDIENKLVFVFFGFFYFDFLFIISEMISPRNVEVPPWYGQ